jgi:hypothetical protein
MSLTMPPPPTLSTPVSHLTYESTTEKKRVLGSALADRARRVATVWQAGLGDHPRSTQALVNPAATPLGLRAVRQAAAGRDQARRIQGRGDGAPADELDTNLPRRADDPFHTFGGTFAGSAGRSRSSGVITRTGPDLPTARKPIDHRSTSANADGRPHRETRPSQLDHPRRVPPSAQARGTRHTARRHLEWPRVRARAARDAAGPRR